MITSAALIMISVFLSFVANPVPEVKMFGLGLAVAVAVDATIVRMMLVPAMMEILGEGELVVPGWLGRILPRIRIEEGVPTPASVPVAVAEALLRAAVAQVVGDDATMCAKTETSASRSRAGRSWNAVRPYVRHCSPGRCASSARASACCSSSSGQPFSLSPPPRSHSSVLR